MRLLLLDNTTCRAKARYTNALKKKLKRFAVDFVVVNAHNPSEVQTVITSTKFDGAILSGSSKTFSQGNVSEKQLTSNELVIKHVRPVLGICFGMQAIVLLNGGQITPLATNVNAV